MGALNLSGILNDHSLSLKTATNTNGEGKRNLGMHPLFYTFVLLLAIFFFLMMYVSVMILFYSEKYPMQFQEHSSGISIVIPFCNEAPRLTVLLESLITQDYPGTYEVILVNDGSSDDFLTPIDPFLRSPRHTIKLVQSDFDKQKKLTSKQQALDTGVAKARYPYLAFTDADMVLSKNWLVSLARMIPLGYDLVFGHTVIRKSAKTFLDFLQAYQLEFLFAVAYAFHTARMAGSCMGNNLLLSKKAYKEVGGQAGIGYSIVEDRALFSAFKRRGMKVAPAYPFFAMAETYPCKDLRSFFHQIGRWARGGFSEQLDLLPIAVLFCVQYVFLILAMVGEVHGTCAFLAYANFGSILFFLFCAFKKMDSKERLFLFPAYYAFLLIEAVAVLLSFAVSPAISWKNRKL
jgi:cellulose synthase/poly-beta-1,6-N-acetylglucosamine synthase-like glycosyltransferase